MEKQNFDFEAFKKQGASRLKNGDTLLGRHPYEALIPCPGEYMCQME
ncbi:hypothetical protein [Chitinophaga qingshengii]|uniref:Uncharacterized protein n=1 Tax=Chitinophaga qingshengii TaxID=1569794 RepID=A0ABR7TM49_9BACT|nr:hypothetical protein [Chitinophaga qingshengii]MBC9931567.1 hypothetical protein [Chitinophaga qingshengii]